jgi:2-amino-4-hydroxy-6-hydroxymethyldihydropteridine diphosphokinase
VNRLVGETAYIGLGANLGDRQASLAAAIQLLTDSPGIRVRRGSRWYESAPVGVLDQPWFLNGVIEIETELSPSALLARLKQIEQQLGRESSRRWGERLIDLDLLLYGDRRVDLPDLVVPHAELWNRRFVLVPLAELRPDLRSPSGQLIGALADQLPEEQQLRPLDEPAQRT